MIRRERAPTNEAMPTRRAKPLTGARYKGPDSVCSVCVKADPFKYHKCQSAHCACVSCAERAGR